MIVVSDTSALNYLILVKAEHVLAALFGRVIAPPAVIKELKRPKAPARVRKWAAKPPEWLDLRTPATPWSKRGLGPGETQAIALALELNADVLLIDERDGTAEARKLGLKVTGTLGVLEMAAANDLLSLPDAIAALRKTTFRGPEDLIERMLRKDEQRRAGR